MRWLNIRCIQKPNFTFNKRFGRGLRSFLSSWFFCRLGLTLTWLDHMWSLSTLCVVAWKSHSWQRPCFRYLRYSTTLKFWVPCFKVQHRVLVQNWNQSHKIIDDYSLCASKLDVILLSMWKISQLKISCWLSAVFVVALPSQQYHGWTFNEIIRCHRKLVSNPPLLHALALPSSLTQNL